MNGLPSLNVACGEKNSDRRPAQQISAVVPKMVSKTYCKKIRPRVLYHMIEALLYGGNTPAGVTRPGS